jgi:hypothetical protein
MSNESLIPTQRQFRHLRGIHVRNISSDNLVNTFLVIKSGDRVLYTSSTFNTSVNPTWIFDDQENNVHMLFTIRNDEGPFFTVNVLENSSTSPKIDTSTLVSTPELLSQYKVLMSCELNFSQLVYIGNPIKTMSREMPLNCMLFEFQDGMFITQLLATTMELQGSELDAITNTQIRPLDTAPVEIPCEEFQRSVAKLVGLSYALAEANEAVQLAKERVERRLRERENIVKLRQEIELRKSRINRLRNLVKVKQGLNNALRTQQEQNQQRHVHIESQFLKSQKLLIDSQQQFQQVGKVLIEHLRGQLTQLQRKVNRRQKNIIKCLNDYIFVIAPHTITSGKTMSQHLTINGLSIYKG